MSKLFELYVYSLLKDAYGSKIIYQLSEDGKRQTRGHYGDIDFMKLDDKILIDTKYKEIYTQDGKYDIDNIRQLSGYARDRKVLEKLNITSDNEVVDCVISIPTKQRMTILKQRIKRKILNSLQSFINVVLSYLQNDKTKDIFCLYLAQVYLPVDATKNVK